MWKLNCSDFSSEDFFLSKEYCTNHLRVSTGSISETRNTCRLETQYLSSLGVVYHGITFKINFTNKRLYGLFMRRRNITRQILLRGGVWKSWKGLSIHQLRLKTNFFFHNKISITFFASCCIGLERIKKNICEWLSKKSGPWASIIWWHPNDDTYS